MTVSLDALSDVDRIYGRYRNLQWDEPPELSQRILKEETELLQQRVANMQTSRDYYEGTQALVYGSPKFRTEVGNRFEGFKDNWVKVVVDAQAAKMRVQGLSITDADMPESEYAPLEQQLWNTLGQNNFDQLQDLVHEGVLVEGRSYVIVDPTTPGEVRIDWNPGQNVSIRWDDDRRAAAWAVKRWQTPSGAVRANVYFPDRIEKYVELSTPGLLNGHRESNESMVNEVVPSSASGVGYGLVQRIDNPLGEVPVVEFRNPKLNEISDVIAQQDAVNFLLVNALEAAGQVGWPQKYMIGNFKEPEGGWKNDPGIVWQLPYAYDDDGNPIKPDAGDFRPVGLSEFVNFTQEMLRHIAATTSTPMRLFYQSDRGGRGDAASGESLRVDDEPLIDKVEKLQRFVGNDWWRVLELTAKARDLTPDSGWPTGEPNWRDPQARHQTVLLQDAKLMLEIGFPFDFIATRVGLNPNELRRVNDLLESQAEEAARVAEVEVEVETGNGGSSSGSGGTPGAQPTQSPRPPSSAS